MVGDAVELDWKSMEVTIMPKPITITIVGTVTITIRERTAF